MVNSFLDRLYVKQWSLGIAKSNALDFMFDAKRNIAIRWISISEKTRCFADPFLIRNSNGDLHILYEDILQEEGIGVISMIVLDNELNEKFRKCLLKTGYHLSYPFVFEYNGGVLVYPEAGQSGKLTCYDYDFSTDTLVNPRTVMDLPLVDSTILFYNNKYWLFATIRGEDVNKKLHIFYSDYPDRGFVPHKKNPVKDNWNGSRPAGAFFENRGNWFRPSQNSANFYGESVAIQRIKVLTEYDFEEEEVITIEPLQNELYPERLHTINFCDSVFVIDGLRRYFMPFNRLQHFFLKRLKLRYLFPKVGIRDVI